jgi:enamine deaminase RidA (YjgF/YER057c/UK114 family)
MTPEERLADIGLTLPAPFPPAAAYVPCRRSGRLLFVSGHGPMRDGKAVYVGKLGRELSTADGQASAELTMLNVLASVKAELGELAKIVAFPRVSIYVNATEDFAEHHLVANGASDLLARLYGPAAAHSRFAVGMSSLPFGIATEIELIAELGPDASVGAQHTLDLPSSIG